MIHRTLLFWVFLLWGVELVLLPGGRFLVDPLFLLLAFLGLRSPSSRFLWLQGLALGLLKDLTTGALWGGWACTFGLVGLLLGAGSRMVEGEDPFVAGVWVAALSGLSMLLYALLLFLADPSGQGFHAPWLWLPFSMAAHGWLAAWGFPRLRRVLRRRPAV